MYQRRQILSLILLFTLFFGALFALPKKALNSSQGRLYDPNTVEVLYGKVANVDSLRPNMQLRLDTDREEIVVHLGPSWYLLQQNFTLLPSDRISVTGSRVTIDGEPAIIAATIKKNNQTLKLRDDQGYPVWGPAPRAP